MGSDFVGYRGWIACLLVGFMLGILIATGSPIIPIGLVVLAE